MPDAATSDVADLAVAVRELAARVDGQKWPRWLSVEGATRYSSLSDTSIRNLISTGAIVPSRTVRGKILIDRLQLDATLLAGCGRELRRGRGIRPLEDLEGRQVSERVIRPGPSIQKSEIDRGGKSVVLAPNVVAVGKT